MTHAARLEGRGVTRRYGGLTAVSGMDIVAEPGAITALIGPNGAGKTTLFNCLTGVERPDEGAVLLDGRDVTRLPSDERARRGIGRTFQRLNVFPTMSVADNLRVGAESRHPGSVVRGLLGMSEPTRVSDRRKVDEVLHRLRLGELRDA
ncbi:MAG TPA: ATP-binding cassette domain-containing protein, partial [Mycobacteriales bacterium]|nr:ATP-binding cassette domain-containing protein [Mycobacteriales bacterium]